MKRQMIDGAEDRITEAAVAGSAVKMIPAGAILCVVRSGILAHTFPVAINTIPVTINQDMRALRVHNDVIPEFVAHYLRFAQTNILHRCAKHGTTVASVEASRLDEYPVPICSDAAQRDIVAKIEELFGEIVDGEHAMAQARTDLDVYRRSLLKAAVTGELTAAWRAANPAQESGAALLARILAKRRARWQAEPKKKEKLSDPLKHNKEFAGVPLPSGWVSTSSTSILQWASGKFMPDRAMAAGSIPVYGGNGITGWHDKALQSEPTLVIGRVGFYCGNAQATDGPVWITDNAIYAREIAAGISPQFLQLVFEFSRVRQFAKGGAQPFISQGLLEAIPLPLPGLTEQVAIVQAFLTFMEDRLTLLRGIETATLDAAALRQSILAAAFRGQLL